MAFEQRYGSPFRRIENPQVFKQHELLFIFNISSLGVGEQIFFSKGYGDNDDCHLIDRNELGSYRYQRGYWELSQDYWQFGYSQSCGIDWNKLTEDENYDLTADTMSMLCMGGEL